MTRELVNPHWDKLVYAHRLAHIGNISYLLDVGFVHPTSEKADPNYIAIGDKTIIKVRDEELFHGYKLSDYIPFYFGPRSPMLFVIQNGLNGVQKYPAADIVYCVIKISTVIEQGWECIFTDGHAITGITEFYTKDKLIELDKLVSVEDVYAKYWKIETDHDLKRRKEAELLVKDEIIARYIAGFFVYNEETKQRIVQMGVDACRVYVAPEYYF